MSRSLWRHLPTRQQGQGGTSITVARSDTAGASWVYGQVLATSADQDSGLPAGWVRVGIPFHAPTSEAAGEADGHLTAVGARVLVILGADGRVVKISDPVIMPRDAAPVALSPAGRMLQAASGALEQTRKALAEKAAELGSAVASAVSRVDEVESGLSEAQDRAEQVARDGERLREQVVEQARRVGVLEGAAREVEERVSAAEREAQTATSASEAAQRAQQQIRESVAQAEREAAKKALEAEAAAKKYADGLKDATLSEAQKRALKVAQAEAEKAQQAAETRLDGLRREHEATKETARQAREVADRAQASAAGAQQGLDEMQGRMTTLGRNVRVSPARPTTADGRDTPTGGLWLVDKPGVLGEVWKWDGRTWHQLKAGADFLQQGVFSAVHAAKGFLGELTAAHGVLGSANIGAVTAEKLRGAIGNLDRGFIQSLITDTGFIRRLFTERISVAASTLFPNSLLEEQDQWQWSSGTVKTWGTDAGVSGHVLTITGARAQRGGYWQPTGNTDSSMHLKPGCTYRITVMVKAASAIGGGEIAAIYVRHRNAAGNMMASKALGVTSKPLSWTRLETQFTLPADAKNGACALGLYVQPALTSGQVSFAEVKVEEAVGSTLIEPNSITTPMLKATSDMWAKLLTVAGNATIGGQLLVTGGIGAREINAKDVWGALGRFTRVITETMLAETIVLKSSIIAGNTAAAYARLDDKGLSIFRTIAGRSTQVASLGTSSSDYLSVIGTDGETKAAIDSGGKAAFQSVNAGQSLVYRGREIGELLDRGARGVVAWGSQWPWPGEPVHVIRGQESAIEVAAALEAGRMYRIGGTFAWKALKSGAAIEARVYMSSSPTSVPTSPKVTSPGFTSRFEGASQGHTVTEAIPPHLLAPAQGTHRILLVFAHAYQPDGCALDFTGGVPVLWIEDIGPAVSPTAQINRSIAPSAAQAPPVQVRTRRTEVITSTWCGYYDNNRHSNNQFYSGKAPFGAYGGSSFASMFGFPDLASRLSGATIHSVRIYVNVAHFWGMTGTLRLGFHNATSRPGIFHQNGGEWAAISGWSRGEAKWVDVPTSLYAGIQNGGYKGLTLAARSDYGYAHDSAAIEIDYTK